MERNGFAHILVGVIIAVTVLGVGGYVFVARKNTTPKPEAHTPAPAEEKLAAQPAPVRKPPQEIAPTAPEKKSETPRPGVPKKQNQISDHEETGRTKSS